MTSIRRAICLGFVAVTAGVISCDSEGRRNTTATSLDVPTQLSIATQPGGAISGARLATQPAVQVLDAESRPARAPTEVTAEINTGTGTLGGKATVLSADGVAAFTDLVVNGSGAHTLRFTSRGLEAVTSASIVISPPDVTPSELTLTTQPANAISGVPIKTGAVVQVRDSSGNPINAASSPVTASIASGSGTLTGTTLVSALGGVATFTDLRVNGAGPHTLTFTSPGLSAVTSVPFEVVQAPASLVVETQPSGATTGAAMAVQPVLRIVDNAGLLVASSTLTVTAAVSTGGGVLLGTRSVAAVGGVVTFTDLRVDGFGSHVLSFTAAAAIPSSLSNAFMVAIGSAAKLAVTTQPGGAVSATPFVRQPVVQVRDAGNSLVTTPSVSVNATVVSGTGTLSGTTTVASVNGAATFTDLVVTGSGTHVIAFSAAGLSSASSTAFTVAPTAPPPDMIAITTQPAGAVSGVALTTQPVVQIRDANNVLVPSAAVPVTAAIAGGDGTLSGTTVVTSANGIAAFTDLAVTGSGTHTLSFSSSGLDAAVSTVFIVSGTATQLAITRQPQGAVSGAPFGTQPIIQVRDAAGNLANASTAAVSVAIASGSGVLTGTTTVNAVNGVASFSDLRITGSGTHSLLFTSPGLTSTTSAAVPVTGGSATQLLLVVQPSSSASGTPFTQQPVVQVRDAAGGVVTNSSVAVTAEIASGTGTLTGATTVAAVNGIVTFAGLAITGSGPHTLRFVAGALTPAVSNSLDIVTSTIGDLANHDFEDGTLGPYYTESGPNVSVVDDPTDKRGGRVTSVRFTSPGPLADINTQFKFDPANVGLGQTIFFRGYVYFTPGTPEFDNPQVQRKLLYGQGGSGNSFSFILDMRAGKDGLYIVYTDGTRQGGLTPDTYINSGPIAMGVWYRIETEVRLNSTETSQDGIIRIWIDGDLKYEKTNVNFMATDGSFNDATTWRSWYIGQQREGRDWNGGAPETNINELRFWDNVAFGSSRLGQ